MISHGNIAIIYFQFALYILPDTQTAAISKSVDFILSDKYIEKAPNPDPIAIPVNKRRCESNLPFFQENR